MSVLTETVRSIRCNPHCSLAVGFSSESGDICTHTVAIEPSNPTTTTTTTLCSAVPPQGNRLTPVQRCHADPKQTRGDLSEWKATLSAFATIYLQKYASPHHSSGGWKTWKRAGGRAAHRRKVVVIEHREMEAGGPDEVLESNWGSFSSTRTAGQSFRAWFSANGTKRLRWFLFSSEAETVPVKHHYLNVWTEAAGKRWKMLHSERRRTRGRICQVILCCSHSQQCNNNGADNRKHHQSRYEKHF